METAPLKVRNDSWQRVSRAANPDVHQNNNRALELGDEKRERAGAALAADSVFPKFGQTSLGLCAC